VLLRGQSPARISRRSGNLAAAPWLSINLAMFNRPRRSQREQATSSMGTLPASSPNVTAPLLFIAAASSPAPHLGAISDSAPPVMPSGAAAPAALAQASRGSPAIS
jgi:hypothetical protein